MQVTSIQHTEHRVVASHQKIVTFDCTFKPSKLKLPVVIFCHGFKGFKDWGAWPIMANFMAELGVFFIKMNFSHNGVNPDKLEEITDLDAFGKNTISKELEDIDAVISWLHSDENPYKDKIDHQLFLIGHSRGGATALLKTVSDSRINKLALWAPVADFSHFVADTDGEWERTGVKYFMNARTGQNMPVEYEFVRDYKDNESQLDTKKNIAKLDKPLFLVHGTADETLPIAHTKTMYKFVSHAIFVEAEGANHTFGAFHPYNQEELPEDLEFVAEETIEFFNM